jgi:O-succinylbenzoic acid--CoA ligase
VLSSPLPDWLAHRARTIPDRLAVIVGGERWTFAELDARANRAARRLAALGVAAGDRVAVLLHNGPAMVELVHAVPRLGAILVPLNARLAAAELAWQTSDVGARLVVAHERTAPLARELGALSPSLAIAGASAADAAAIGARAAALDATAADDAPLRDGLDPAAVHTIVYTSGTTGRPKGAMLTVGNHWWSAIGSALNVGVREDDRWLACLPLFHVGGLAILLRGVVYGTAAVVHESFDAGAVSAAIDEERVTIVSLVAAMLQRVLEARGDAPVPATLRLVLLGGGPAPRPLLEACARRGVPVSQTYGLTETASQVTTLRPADALRRLGAAGTPLYPNEVRIGDPDDAAVASGEPGEILVRGPIVSPGYWGSAEEDARLRAGGWLHTGDIGRLDADGYLHVLDRRADLIVSGGENVYPAEVESALLAHPAVAEAAVVGEPDERWGERVVAVVRARDGAAVSEEELRAHCRSRLGGYKVPARIRFVKEPLPRTAAGKLLRRALRAPGDRA